MKLRMGITLPGLVLVLLLAACQPATDDRVLPTVALLPSETFTPVASPTPTLTTTPTLTQTATITLTPSLTYTATPTYTATALPSPTPSHTPTLTPTVTATPRVTRTPNPTFVAIATATARIVEAPTLATFTPVPPGVDAPVRPTSTGTPVIAAGVIITEPQFQEQLNLLLRSLPAVTSALVDFVPQGVQVEITASGGDALVTGRVLITFSILPGEQGLNNVLMIRPVTPDQFTMTGGGLPSEAFVQVVYTDVFPAVGEAFNTILNNRLGVQQHNLENIRLDEQTMNVSLIVPQR
ncbi:MAG: hypothetical protein MUE40_01420 [Anaerolineae bacterium]|nr:hypothetical protein [Anaerolineae bacterium]